MNDRIKHKQVTRKTNHQTAEPKANASVFLFFPTPHFLKTILACRTSGTFGFAPTHKADPSQNQKSHFFPTAKEHLSRLIHTLRLMLKKICSILLIFSAFAMLLGHNLIGHHHHDKEQIAIDHSHADDHHHDNENDEEENDFDFLHFLSHIPHDSDVVTFLKGKELGKTQYKQLNTSALLQTHFTFNPILDIERQNAPPFKVVYFNSQHYLPSGLRAPPVFIS
jgi:hypothetical protein